MSTCKILNDANGKDSSLFPQLLVAFNDNFDQAKDAYDRIISEPFMNKFGNWKKNYNSVENQVPMGKTLPSGEPELFKNPVTRKYYFELADGTRMPLKDGFRQNFSPEEVQDVTDFLLYVYVEKGGAKSLNKFQAENKNKSSVESLVKRAVERYRGGVEASFLNEELSQEDADILLDNIDRVEEFSEEFADKLIYAVEALGEKITSVQELEQSKEDNKKGGGLNMIEYATVNPKSSATINTKILLSQITNVKYDIGYSDVEVFLNDEGYYSFVNPATDEFMAENTRITDEREADAYSLKLSKTKQRVTTNNMSEFLNVPRFVPLNEVWETLFPRLSDKVTTVGPSGIENSYMKMRAELEKLSIAKPWAKELLEKLTELEDANRYKVYEFVQAFSKTKINYYVTEVNPKSNQFKVLNATATNSRESQIISEWGIVFKEKFLPTSLTLTNDKKKEVLIIGNNIEEISESFNKGVKLLNGDKLSTDELYTEIAESLTFQMHNLGMTSVIPEDINYYIKANGGTQEMNTAVRDLIKGLLFTVNQHIGQKANFNSADGLFNPFKEESVVKKFAESVSLRMIDISESNILANNNKNYFAYANPTYISNKLNEWRDNPEELQELARLPYNTNSDWIRHLAAFDIKDKDARLKKSNERLEKFKSGVSSSYKSVGKNDGVDNTQISFEDQLNDNINKLLKSKLKGGKSYFPSIVAADKSRRVEFEGIEMFHSKISEIKGVTRISDTSVNRLLDYFEDEYSRMIKVSEELDTLPRNMLIKHYHTGNINGLKSQLFPEFNPGSTNPNLQDVMAILYDSKGRPVAPKGSTGLTPSQRDVLFEHVRKSLSERVKDAKKLLEESATIDTRIKKAYNGDMTAIAGDYIMNGLISTVEYTKMFSGDPAYYKDGADLIKRIPATYTDGLQLYLEKDADLTFNAAIISGVEVASKYVDKIKESVRDKSIANAYERVNTTDAQAWITPNRWKFLKQGLGQWSDLHDSVFDKMMKGEELEKHELKLAAQPLKGVYFEINRGIPTYLKYSQAVLVPSVVKGTEMERLYDKMTADPNNEIHEVITVDGIKVGALGPTPINKEGSTELLDEFDLNSSKLSNKGWKLQQDLPVKTMKKTDIGSQIQKNILDSLNRKDVYTDKNGEEIGGAVLLQKIHDAVSKLSNIGQEEISEELDIKDGKISNKDKLYNALIKEFKDRGGNENIIDALESRVALDAIPQIRGRVDSILMTMFKRKLIKIQTQGGSFIQVSPFGIQTITDSEKNNIKIVSDNYNKEGLLPPRREEGVKRTLPGQVMIPMSLAKEIIKKNPKFKNIDEITDKQWKELFSQKEAREIIGYRIPNQGMSSNDTLEVVGILPPEMGDSIIGYDGIPAKTGSDFDIDKMFVMVPSLVYNTKSERLETLTTNNKEFYKGKDSLEKAISQNVLIELYQDILQSEHTYDNMMRSIDSTLLKDDINFLHEESPATNLQLFDPIHQLQVKRNYMSGKTGVGLTANQLVDHVANQTLDIGIVGALGLDGMTQKVNRLDQAKETSAVLSEFLNAYVDIAKDPYISRGNHNDVTANAVFMLIRAGVSLGTVNRLVGQPVLKEYVRLKKQSESISGKPLLLSGKKVDAETYIRETYNIKPDYSRKETVSRIEGVSTKEMENNILNAAKGSPTNNRVDAAVFNAFLYYDKIGREVTSATIAAKVDVNAGGLSPLELNINIQKIQKAIESETMFGYKEKFINTAAGTYRENGLNWVKRILSNSDILLTGSTYYDQALGNLNRDLGKGDYLTNLELAKSLNNFYYTYLMSGTNMFKGNRDDFDNIFSEVPKKILKMKKQPGNFLVDELELDLRIIGTKAFSFVGINNKNKPAEYQNNIHRGWLDLYHNTDTKDLAIDLARYAFSQSGFQPNLNQFYTYIPQEIMTDLGMNKDVNSMFKFLEINTSDPILLNQIARHNADNPKIVPTVFKLPEGMSMAKMNAGFQITPYEFEKMIGKSKVDTNYMSIVSGEKTYLYKKHPSSTDEEINFTRISKLGYTSGKNKVFEYALKTDIINSVLDINNFSVKLQNRIAAMNESFETGKAVNTEFIESNETTAPILDEMSDAEALSLRNSAFFNNESEDVLPDGDYIDESKIISMEELLSKLPQLKKDGDVTDKGCE